MSLLELLQEVEKLFVLNLHFFDYGLSQIMDVVYILHHFKKLLIFKLHSGDKNLVKYRVEKIVVLTGETSADLRLLESGDVIFAITNYSSDRPAIVFVPSRRQCRLTAVDLLTFCS